MIDKEKVIERLTRLYEEVEVKRLKITSFDGYSKDTFLAFDSFNLGVTTALDLIGRAISDVDSFLPKPRVTKSEVKWLLRGGKPAGWYTVHENSFIFYGDNKEHAQEQSNAMNDFLARKLFDEYTE